MEPNAEKNSSFAGGRTQWRAAPVEPLSRVDLLTQQMQASLDRIVIAAGEQLAVPVAFMWLVDSSRRLVMSCAGMSAPIAMLLSYPFCRHVVASGKPLSMSDGREHPMMAKSAAVRYGTVRAYAGRPLLAPDGHAIGTLCVMDPQPRSWTGPELKMLGELAAQLQS